MPSIAFFARADGAALALTVFLLAGTLSPVSAQTCTGSSTINDRQPARRRRLH